MSLSGSPYVLNEHELNDNDLANLGSSNSQQPAVFKVDTPAGERFDLAPLEQVLPEDEIDWLWPGMIPLRKVTLLEGPSGAGKSQLALDLAARVSRSAPWPSGEPSLLPTADVLHVCRRDEAAAASARFERAGGDRKKLFHFGEFWTFLPVTGVRDTRPIVFRYDFPALERIVEDHESFGMIIIDSLADFCSTPKQVAETLVLLQNLASRANVALIVTLPANCRVDAQGRLRVTSRWPTDKVRSAWCVLPDPDDPRRRLFVAKRTNFCLEPDGLAYRLNDRGVAWEPRSRISPLDPLGQLSASDLCLAKLLGEGPVPARAVYRLGAELGFSPKQLQAAGKRLGASSERIGFSGDGHWSWSLPGVREVTNSMDARSVEAAEVSVGCRSPQMVAQFEGADIPGESASLTQRAGPSPEWRDVPRNGLMERELEDLEVATKGGRTRHAFEMEHSETHDGTRDQPIGRCPPATVHGNEQMERGETLDGTWDQPTGRCPPTTIGGNEGRENEESMGIFGESLENGGRSERPDLRARRRQRRTKRNRKKEQRQIARRVT